MVKIDIGIDRWKD